MTTLGTTTSASLTVPTASSTSYPVQNLNQIAATPPSFVNGVFTDTALTDYINGTPMTMTANGTLGF